MQLTCAVVLEVYVEGGRDLKHEGVLLPWVE